MTRTDVVARRVKGRVSSRREFEPHPSYCWYFKTLLSRTTKIASPRIFFRYVRSVKKQTRGEERERDSVRGAATMRIRLVLSTSRRRETRERPGERNRGKRLQQRLRRILHSSAVVRIIARNIDFRQAAERGRVFFPPVRRAFTGAV